MKTATHYLPMKDGKTPQMYYRVIEGLFNTGEKYRALQYYSSFGVWQGSMERDIDKFIKERLIEIPGWEPLWVGRKSV